MFHLFLFLTAVSAKYGMEAYLENGRLTQNILLGRPGLHYPDTRGRTGLAHPTLWDLPGDLAAVCLQKGTHVDHFAHYHVPIQDADDLPWITQWCDKVEVVLTSFYDGALTVLYENTTVGTVGSTHDNTFYLNSYVGDTLVIRHPNGTVLDNLFVDSNLTRVYAPPEYFTQKRNPSPPVTDLAGKLGVLHELELHRASRVKYHFTPVGFKKQTIPTAIWALLSQFYHVNNHTHAKFREDWHDKGLYVNHYETEEWPTMIIPGFGFKEHIYRLAIPYLEAWIGHSHKLEPTDIYGIRTYYRGARLQPHVDRTETHAVSLIINLDQQGVGRPWQVNIRDHDDRLHQITMAPGEWVYYESASCLHSRTEALDGESYANIFVHTRPLANPEWYKEVDGYGFSSVHDEL